MQLNFASNLKCPDCGAEFSVFKEYAEHDCLFPDGTVVTPARRLQLPKRTQRKSFVLPGQEVKIEDKARLWPSCRMGITLTIFFGCVVSYMMRMNLSFALVCMVKSEPRSYSDKRSRESAECQDLTKENKTTASHEGEFTWSRELQGFYLSSFFCGYLITTFIAGFLAERVGSKIVIVGGMFFCGVLTVAVPPLTRMFSWALIMLRFLQGTCSGSFFPSTSLLLSYWAPPFEMGTFASIVYAGIFIGYIVTFPLCGILCSTGIDQGWPLVFYVIGGVAIVWSYIAWYVIYDNVDLHPYISMEEKIYLHQRLEFNTPKIHTIPWKSIFTSKCVWATKIAHISGNWTWYTLGLCVPLFMKEILQFDIRKNGMLSSLPYVATFLITLLCGQVSKYIVKHDRMPLTDMRKLWTCLALSICSLCMCILPFVTCHERYIAVLLLIVGEAFLGLGYSGGFFVNYIDIAPPFASLLMSCGNAGATIAGIISPTLAGFVTRNGTREEWGIIFYITAVIGAVGCVMFFLFGTAERQLWSYPDYEPTRRTITLGVHQSVAKTNLRTMRFGFGMSRNASEDEQSSKVNVRGSSRETRAFPSSESSTTVEM